METKILSSHTEHDIPIQEKNSLTTTKDELPPKRIRKRIKYTRPVSELQIKNSILKGDENFCKTNIF